MWHKKTSLEALLDCGATHNFIDTHTAEKLKIRVCPLWQPLIVNNVDGTMNSGGNITHFCNLWLMHGEVTHKQGFYVANLGWDWLILGHPWFKTFNPAIDWSTSTLQGDDMMIETAGYWAKVKIPTACQLVTSPNEVEAEKAEILKQIPEEYHHHWKVFSEKTSHHYSPAWDEDHAITLKPGAPATMDCKIYWQTDKELEANCKFVNEHWAKGYMKESNSLYAPPCSPEQRRMANYGLLSPKIMDCLRHIPPSPYQWHHQSPTREDFYSPNSTFGGATTTFASGRKTSGQPLSKHPLPFGLYIPQLVDYNFTLVQVLGTTNKADALSRCPDFNDGSTDNSDITVLPPHLFTWESTLSSLDDHAKACQLQQHDLLKWWSHTFSLKQTGDLFWYGDWLVVMEDLPLRRGVISLYHNSPTAGHPGISNTMWAITCDYWWPNMTQTITEYIKGCALCQSHKNNPTKPKPPLYPILSDMYTLPCSSIALDFIVKLPSLNTCDIILTITDPFSKVSIFIPCNESMAPLPYTPLMYFPITDSHPASYLTETHDSQHLSQESSAESWTLIKTSAQCNILKQMDNLNTPTNI